MGSGCGGGGAQIEDDYFDNAIPGVFNGQGLVDYSVTDTAITIELDEGSKDDATACAGAASLDPAEVGDRTITITFPDGEIDCTDG